jgi:hypothetical protein
MQAMPDARQQSFEEIYGPPENFLEIEVSRLLVLVSPRGPLVAPILHPLFRPRVLAEEPCRCAALSVLSWHFLLFSLFSFPFPLFSPTLRDSPGVLLL